jgi:carboxypeptidase B
VTLNTKHTILLLSSSDGFKYAWSTNRFWRKTRRPSQSLFCIGADPNRNSDVHWNETNASTNPCAHNFPGDFAFSEPEIYQLSEFMKKNVSNLQIYFSFHTYGQFFMIPRGFTEERMENYDLHVEIGTIANEAIFNKTGAVYELGPIQQFFGKVFMNLYDLEINIWDFLQDSCQAFHSTGLSRTSNHC